MGHGVGHGAGEATLSPRTGRRAGHQPTREAILGAARRRFAELGFKGATIRAIAADAGVDPALVLHYFGSKVELFTAAVHLPVSPAAVLATLRAAGRDGLGEALLRALLDLWEQPEALDVWLGLVRSAVSEERAATMLREFLGEAVLRDLADIVGGADADYRVALVASQIVGLGIARYVVRLEPLASAAPGELVATMAPNLQRYLTGDLTP